MTTDNVVFEETLNRSRVLTNALRRSRQLQHGLWGSGLAHSGYGVYGGHGGYGGYGGVYGGAYGGYGYPYGVGLHGYSGLTGLTASHVPTTVVPHVSPTLTTVPTTHLVEPTVVTDNV